MSAFASGLQAPVQWFRSQLQSSWYEDLLAHKLNRLLDSSCGFNMIVLYQNSVGKAKPVVVAATNPDCVLFQYTKPGVVFLVSTSFAGKSFILSASCLVFVAMPDNL